jgi:DGQHR domain-containing protein
MPPRKRSELIPAIKIKQAGVEMYVSAVPLHILASLDDRNVLDVAQWRPQDARGRGDAQENYQRPVSVTRANRIKKYAEIPQGPNALVLPLFPQSAILNIRVAQGIRKPRIFTGEHNAGIITFPENAQYKLWEVDGQHRIEGLIRAYRENPRPFRDFKLPVTILNGLSLDQEAAQFLIINTTQNPVRSDLELRVMYERQGRTQNFQNLLDILKWDAWSMEALDITRQMERPGFVWEHRIVLPGESRSATGTISEGQFVATLGRVCSKNYALGRRMRDERAKFLDEIWTAFGGLYPECFAPGAANVLVKTTGVGAIHWLAPILSDLSRATGQDTVAIVHELVSRRNSDWWRSGGEGAAAFGSGKAAWKKLAENLLSDTFRLALDEDSLRVMEARNLNPKQEDMLQKTVREFQYSRLHTYTRDIVDDVVNDEMGGSYGLVKLRELGSVADVYGGRGGVNRLQDRIREHFDEGREYTFFFYTQAHDGEEAAYLEYALYHLIEESHRFNMTHPNNIGPINCPYC